MLVTVLRGPKVTFVDARGSGEPDKLGHNHSFAK